MTCSSPDSLQKLLRSAQIPPQQPAELQHQRLGHLAPMCGEPGISIRRRAPLLESPVDESLHAERASTSAGRFHLRIVELEAGAFERVHEVHFNAIQV